MTEPWIIAIATNAVVLVAVLWAGSVRTTWKVAAMRAEIIAAITSHAKEDEDEFSNVRREANASVIAFGETIMAIKQEVSGIRLYCAETYVRREGFYKAMEALTENVASLRKELRADLQRMELKIDAKHQ